MIRVPSQYNRSETQESRATQQQSNSKQDSFVARTWKKAKSLRTPIVESAATVLYYGWLPFVMYTCISGTFSGKPLSFDELFPADEAPAGP